MNTEKLDGVQALALEDYKRLENVIDAPALEVTDNERRAVFVGARMSLLDENHLNSIVEYLTERGVKKSFHKDSPPTKSDALIYALTLAALFIGESEHE